MSKGNDVTAWTIIILLLAVIVLCVTGKWYEWNNAFDQVHETFYEVGIY